jgi:diguanylate cyclase (GGDEF)-like protein
MNNEAIKVLLIEDNPGDALLLQAILQEGDPPPIVQVADRLSKAVQLAEQDEFDIVLLDLSLPDSHGMDTVIRASENFNDQPIIVLTGLDDDQVGIKAVQLGAQDYLVKDQVSGALLRRTFRYALERHRMREALLQASLLDELTGLYNRRGFLSLATRELARAARKQVPCLVMFADLDGLKPINDHHGHAAGDWAIRKAGQCLRSCLRSSDLIARIGGDEFTALVIGLDAGQGNVLAQAIDAECNRISDQAQKPYRLGMSVGFYEYTGGEEEDLDSLLSKADSVLYTIKQERKVPAR